MKIYLLSLGAGVLVGVIYGLLHVRSPAPPLVALVGLFGILIGEQLIPVGEKMLKARAFVAACECSDSFAPLVGGLDRHKADRPASADVDTEQTS
jgi:XapX domain-containing protein